MLHNDTVASSRLPRVADRILLLRYSIHNMHTAYVKIPPFPVSPPVEQSVPPLTLINELPIVIVQFRMIRYDVRIKYDRRFPKYNN